MSAVAATRSHASVVSASALITTSLAQPLKRWLTQRGSLDVPNYRSSHSLPIPRGGGLAALAGSASAAFLTGNTPTDARSCSIAVLATLGWADDTTGHLPILFRLAVQAGTGAVGLTAAKQDPLLSAVVTSGIVNVVNFMDGINGISALTGMTWGINAMLLHSDSDGDLANLGALITGASLGFLPHNAPRAHLFLGDVGSYSLGAAMAAGVLSQSTMAGRYRAAAPLLLYGLDASQAILRRVRAGQSLTTPHREHIYQRMVDNGTPHLEMAVIHSVGSILISLASRLPAPLNISLTTLTSIAYLNAPSYYGRLRSHIRRPKVTEAARPR